MLDALQQEVGSGYYAVALFSYESGMQLQKIDSTWKAQDSFTSRVLIFLECELLDKNQVSVWLETQCQEAVMGIGKIHASVDEAAFCSAIATVRDYIAAGDTYQVNYTYRHHFDVFGSPVALYYALRQRQPVPYGACICLPEGDAVLSLSPELFIRHHQGNLTARPMKGTAAASDDPHRNQAIANALHLDEKNRTENVMIVDLLRNDLGRISSTGSVKVSKLFEVTRYARVLQMTSTVEATLRPNLGLHEVMTALFPCGSITGAPKHRTMQIIDEIESTPRGIYTGAIGWFDPPNASLSNPESKESTSPRIADFCLSVPIRTLHLSAPNSLGVRQGVMGVGAGIVHDSVAEDEYAECALKASFLTGLESNFQLFETMFATQQSGCRYQERHLHRLQQSAHCFGFAFNSESITQQLRHFCEHLLPEGAYRVRLALSKSGEITLSSGLLNPLPPRVKLWLANDWCDAIDSTYAVDPLFLAHKTTHRHHYDLAWKAAEARGGFDMLFINQQGYVTEGGRSNLFIRQGNRWLTPPLSDGVLPGIMRAIVLADPQMHASEQQLSFDDVRRADQIMVCNSLRGVMPAELLVN